MFASGTLDIVIGLVMIFLLVSIMLTALVEAIEARLKTRAVDLEKAIKEIFSDGGAERSDLVESFYTHPLIFALYRGVYPAEGATDRRVGANLPSYIPRDLFSAAVLDLVKTVASNARIAEVVEKLGASVNLAQRKANLESYYDGVMDRIAGQYKRRTHKLLFWLGLGVAIVFNINPFVIGQYLAENPTARDQLVQLAQRVQAEDEAASQAAEVPAPESTDAVASEATNAAAAEAPGADATGAATAETTPPTEETRDKGATTKQVNDKTPPPEPLCSRDAKGWEAAARCQQAIAEIGIPLGWSHVTILRTFPHSIAEKAFWPSLGWFFFELLLALIGFAITGLAATLGAPFWFDVLNKIMVIRSTVKPKEKSGDEASEDRTLKTAPASAAGPAAGPGAPQAPAHAADDGAVG